MLTKYFLDQIGVTEAQFTKFVKRGDEKVEDALEHTAGVQLAVPRTRTGHRGAKSAHSCCGVAELSDLSGAEQSIVNAAVAAALLEYDCVIYYSNNRPTTRRFQKIGFEVVQRFRNPNTGNQIDICILKVS